jgi:hypothetical protein
MEKETTLNTLPSDDSVIVNLLDASVSFEEVGVGDSVCIRSLFRGVALPPGVDIFTGVLRLRSL